MKGNLKNQKGFVAIVPILVVAALLLLSLTITSIKSQSSQNKVLGDSIAQADTGGQESNHDLQQTFEVHTPEPQQSSDNQKSVETPEPAQTPEVRETPEPTHTPEVEREMEVKDGTVAAKVKIHAGDAFQFEQDGLQVQVQGKAPVSVDPVTKQLTVSTQAGQKTVATLPVTAVQNLINSGVLSSQTNVNLVTDANGNLVYEINGVKYEKLLGLFTVAIDKTGQVSAQNGQVIGINQSTLSKLLDLISF